MPVRYERYRCSGPTAILAAFRFSTPPESIEIRSKGLRWPCASNAKGCPDYWSAIPIADFRGYTCHGDVTYVWEDATQRFQFVHFNSDDRNVFMVIVLDVARSRVMGHHLLDLKALYGILEV